MTCAPGGSTRDVGELNLRKRRGLPAGNPASGALMYITCHCGDSERVVALQEGAHIQRHLPGHSVWMIPAVRSFQREVGANGIHNRLPLRRRQLVDAP